MLSFHNDQALKDKYLTRALYHEKADHIVRGIGWNGEKGCSIGCILEEYNHKKFEDDIGPEWLARLIDTLYEGMSEKKSHNWTSTWVNAFPKGLSKKDFEIKVKAPFLIFVLEEVLKTFDNTKFPDVTSAVNGSIALWRRDDIGTPEWEEAAWAARTAAWAAAMAARAAADAAADAAWAAMAAAEAARTAEAAWAARAARTAAWAARTVNAVYDKYADKLIELLAASPDKMEGCGSRKRRRMKEKVNG